MPELPDILAYIHALETRIVGQRLERVRIASPFLLRTVEPPLSSIEGSTVHTVSRIGKRIVIALDDHRWLVLHLMIAGRLHWKPAGAPLTGTTLAAFDFPTGTLTLTEAGHKRRASLYLLSDEPALRSLDRGGVELFPPDFDRFHAALGRENHTLKRALTDPTIVSGIGNAYSDEILHAARLSPLTLTRNLSSDDWHRLFDATIDTLITWTERLKTEAGDDFPERVTAFRKQMAAHGRFGKPCPRCGAKIQRIRYADNETNYCAQCQTGGKVLADRALSRLLR